jgi:hypothetical protein
MLHYEMTDGAFYKAGNRETWNGKLDSIRTIGALHEAIEERFGPPGWPALMECWEASRSVIRTGTDPVNGQSRSGMMPGCDITSRTSGQCNLPGHDEYDQGARQKNVTHPFPIQAENHSSEAEAAARAISELPPRVRRFWLADEEHTPAWRHQETGAEQ